jgi:hypothetical protein
MPNISRTIFLKSIELGIADDPKFVRRPLSKMVLDIAKKAKTVESRHFPTVSGAGQGQRCAFIDKIENAPGLSGGVIFRFCSYRKGHLPLGLTPDFSQPSVDVAASRLVDTKTSSKREPAAVLWAVAFGHVLVMESVRGPGGVGAMERYLWEAIRTLIDPHYPRVRLLDVETHEAKAAIERGGGIKEVILDAVRAHNSADHTFGVLLNDAIKKVGGTDVVRLSYKATGDGQLKREDVLKAYDDLDADEVDRLVLFLRDGSQLVGNEVTRVRRVLKLEADSAGQINEGDLILEMCQFLLDLQKKHDGVSVITTDGNIA